VVILLGAVGLAEELCVLTEIADGYRLIMARACCEGRLPHWAEESASSRSHTDEFKSENDTKCFELKTSCAFPRAICLYMLEVHNSGHHAGMIVA